MAATVQAQAAAKFAADWKGRGYEKGESQTFWLMLLQNVYGVTEPDKYIVFEDQVHLDHTSFIDGSIETTHVLIEQKSLGKDLMQPIKQSDGTLLNPFQQAKRYAAELPYSKRPRWIVTCNFSEFNIYDMEKPGGDPEVVYLKDLGKEYYRLQFLVDTGSEHIKREMEVSLQAGELVGVLYDSLLKQYKDPSSEETMRSLNALCVRIVFCLYAEDAGIFGRHGMFHDYLQRFDARHTRRALVDLFHVLDTPVAERDEFLADDDPLLAAFPYVNGGLFSDETITVPPFTDELRALLLDKASADFDWSEISPTIFGAVFESTLNPETRRSSGMHYTSIENIHKVIDPLFLDGLKEELEEVKQVPVFKTRKAKAEALQKKLSSLVFLDPAAGSGNFLTETYISLRRIENELLRLKEQDQISLGFEQESPIQVSISQFYGIEINDFAVTVARTALWIAESQMMKETEGIVHMSLDFLPLKSYANITEGNALRLDWEDVVPKDRLSYIMGNPPFVGARMMKQGSAQKREVEDVFGKIKDVQDLDYVTCWYKLASQLLTGTGIKACFVSTNSICQGAQVPILWGQLYGLYKIHIDFAYQTFKWNSESSDQAAVHCVIIGFSSSSSNKKYIYSDGTAKAVNSISPYLIEGEETFVTAAKNALCAVPKMMFGNQPRDGGAFILTEEDKANLLKQDPNLEKWIHVYMGAEEFINGKRRYCLWLAHTTPGDIRKSSILHNRVESVRNFRLNSNAKTTRGYAKVPNCFAQMTQPEGKDYLLVPRVSSERRRYIPIGFMSTDIISSDAVQIVPGANIYHFGVLTSNVHNAWMRTVAGRLEMRYRYSKEIVYNTFPWPSPTEAQREKIEQTAQAILDARALYPESSLADLYDELTMPPELRKAHQANDRTVMAAYGWKKGDAAFGSEAACVAELMKLYQALTEKCRDAD